MSDNSNIQLPDSRLSDGERKLVHRVFTQGPAALIDDGYTPDQVQDFLARVDVQAELSLLGSEYKNQEALQQLARFMARRRLIRMVPNALDVIENGLEGPEYRRGRDGRVVRDANGKMIVDEPEVTRNQLHTAEEILDRIGVEPEDRRYDRVDIDVNVLFQKIEEAHVSVTLNPDYDKTEEQALSRERVRTFIEQLKEKLPEAREMLEAELIERAKGGRSRGGKKKVGKKKTSKKKTAGRKSRRKS